VTRHFRSKVDVPLLAPLAIAVLLPLWLMARRVLAGESPALLLVPVLALAAVGTVLDIAYAVTDKEVIVRRGPFRSRMPLHRIRALKATRDWLSSPALSLDRIEIRTDRGSWLMISPADKSGFVRAIQARVPGVVLDGLAPPEPPQRSAASHQ